MLIILDMLFQICGTGFIFFNIVVFLKLIVLISYDKAVQNIPNENHRYRIKEVKYREEDGR